jgi:hypothetical protein
VRAIVKEFGQPALPVSREESGLDISSAIHKEGLLCWLRQGPTSEKCYNDIKALIQSLKVMFTREWVGETARMLVVEANQVHHDIFGCGMPQERYDILRKVYESYLSDRLREKGIEVKP